jgi:uncharacterized protein YyaL (SSP411 family)
MTFGKGEFSIWTPDEIRTVLSHQADHFIRAYGATGHGNFLKA